MLHLSTLAEDFILGNSSVITSATNNGATSLTLFLINCLLREDLLVIYYNPTRGIDRTFVQHFYPRAYNSVIWACSPLYSFLEFLQDIDYSFDCLVIDPGDTMMINPTIIRSIPRLRPKGSTLIFTSQIRMDPKMGWAPYSTIERLNTFDYSIWITNITEASVIFARKWIDVHDRIRSGNNYIARYTASFTTEGNIVA